MDNRKERKKSIVTPREYGGRIHVRSLTPPRPNQMWCTTSTRRKENNRKIKKSLYIRKNVLTQLQMCKGKIKLTKNCTISCRLSE
jgi:hypothetical protein